MNEKNNIKNTLDKPDRGLRQATGELSKLFRKILFERDIEARQWDTLMRRYLSDSGNHIPDNSRDQSTTRGNLNKELNKRDMTWKTFVKGLKFLGAVSVKFSVTIKWPNGTQTVHERDVLVRTPKVLGTVKSKKENMSTKSLKVIVPETKLINDQPTTSDEE